MDNYTGLGWLDVATINDMERDILEANAGTWVKIHAYLAQFPNPFDVMTNAAKLMKLETERPHARVNLLYRLHGVYNTSRRAFEASILARYVAYRTTENRKAEKELRNVTIKAGNASDSKRARKPSRKVSSVRSKKVKR